MGWSEENGASERRRESPGQLFRVRTAEGNMRQDARENTVCIFITVR